MVSFTRLSSAATSDAPAAPTQACAPPAWLADSAVPPPGTPLPPVLAAAAAAAAASASASAASASAPRQRAPATRENLLHRLLRELGPQATDPQHMASLKSALAPFGRPTESAVARAILVMAATAGRTPSPSGPGGEGTAPKSASTEVPTVFQMFRLFAAPDGADVPPPPAPEHQLQPAVDPSDWNPASFVRVVTDLANASGTPLDWPAVVRRFDVAELPTVLHARSLRVILHVYNVATGRPVLPGESLVGRWTHAAAQLAMLNCVLTLPGSVNWQTVKPAVESSPEEAASPFRCIPLMEALVDLDARNLLQAAAAASPDLVLLALTMSSPQANGASRQHLLIPLLSSRLAAFPKTSVTVKRMWAISRPIVEVGLQRLWQADAASLPRILDIVQFLGALPQFLSSSAGFPAQFCLDLAIASFRRDLLDLEKWLADRLAEAGATPVTSCVLYLSEAAAGPGHPVARAMSLEAAAIFFRCLFGALSAQPPQPSHAEAALELRRVYDIFVSLNPRLADLSNGWGAGASKNVTVVGPGSAGAGSGTSPPGAKVGGVDGGRFLAPAGGVDGAEAFPPEVDAEADKHYKRLYQEEVTVEQTIDLLTKLRASPNLRDRQVYRCMIHTLFDEYRFLTKYPDRELRITGMLFGALAQYSVLSGKELGVLLSHVLEALSSVEPSPRPVGRLAKFGLCALERCKGRLSEFPTFCARVLSLARLREVVPELYADVGLARRSSPAATSPDGPSAAEKEVGAPWLTPSPLVAVGGRVGGAAAAAAAAGASPGATADGAGGASGSLAVEPLEVAGSLSRAPSASSSATVAPRPIAATDVDGAPGASRPMSAASTPQKSGLRPSPSGDGGFQFATVNMDTLLGAQQQAMEVPDSATQDKIHFIFNNLSATNMDVKEDELTAFLEPKHVDFLAHYVVVKRASIEPNFHGLYIRFLTRIAKHVPRLFAKVFDRSFINVRILLESGKIVSSSSERLLLKSLGSWIGALTLARNKPLLRKELDIKELLLDAYSNGRLIAVVPFVSKLLVMSKGSLVFKPTNPWLAAILRLLKEIYSVPDLKLNVKFELPLLTKELGIDANEIEPSQQLRFRPAPVRDGNPDFTAIKKLAGVTSPVRSGSPDASPVRAGAREAVRAEAFVAGGASGDGSAPGASGVPIFSLGGVPPGGAGGPGGGLTALSDMASVIGAVGGGGGVRANAPGSEAVADLATIMATASLASSGVQQHTGPLQRLGGGRGGGGSAAAVAAAAAAAQQAAAAAAAAVANEANLIPNLVQHIVISPSLVMFQTAPHLKTYIPAAIDRAVREIINPVVERSCAIATITTRELALKDFAHEMDAAKVQRAAKQMVQQLAGSLALVTCKEPLRVSMGNQLRPQLSPAAAGDTNLLEQTVQVLCTSNLEIGCAIIELAATERAARDINEVIAPLFSARRQQHPQQQRHGFGLLAPSSAQDVLRVYDDFAALPRTAAASAVPVNPAAGGPPGGSFTGYLPSPAVQPGGSAGGARPGSAGVGGESSATMSARGHGIAPAAAHAPMPSRSAARQMTYSTAPGGSSGVAGAPGGAADPFGAAAAIGAPAGAAGAASVMASPSAMAEAMRIATAQAPSMSAAHVLSSSSVPMAPGEDKLSTQQVLELFNTVYPHLTAAILSAVEAASPSSGSSSSAAQGTDALSLADLSADHEVQRCRLQIAQAVKRSLTADEASMAVAQKVFKRLYEGDSNLHRDVHVSLLESMRECSRRLSKELVSWLAYSDDSKKLNRECAVALLRPGSLLHITSYDELVAKACDNGRNSAAMEFAAFLVQRVIIEEPLTTTRELYLTLEVLTKVGRRSPPGAPPSAPQGLIALVEACRNVVHRPAPSPSAGSAASSSGGNAGGQGGASGSAEGHLAAAAKAARAAGEAEAMDPPGSRETVASVLTEWQRVLSSGTATRPVSDRVVASFVTQAKPTTLYNDEARDRFLRIGIDLVCVATSGGLNSRSKGAAGAASPIATAPYTPVEAMVRLVAALCKTETSGESAAKGVAMLVAYLQALVRSIVKATHGGDVRPHFRLFLGIVTELSVGMPAVDSGETSASATLEQDGTSASASTPSSTGENGIWNGLEPALPSRSADGFGGGGAEQAAGTANFQVLSTIASALNACNPHLAPSFAFAWLQIVSNRDVMPRLLSYRSGKGWQLLRQLVVSMLSFLSPHLARVGPQGEIPAPIRSLYRGILRVLLVLLHDFPEFLCDYHFALCDVIPPSCIQMRNLVLSAYPRSMRLPDPFMPNLKVDKLAEMAAEPRVLSNLTTSLVGAGVKAIVDKFLHDPAAQPAASLGLHAKLLAKDRPPSYNVPAINAVVLYLGQQSIARTAPGAQPVINGPSTEVLQSLIADLGGEGRYHLLNAIANQLRYPNSHTHYFSCVLLFLFRDSSDDSVKEQITRVLVERLIANRPHPWGLLITFIELIKNTEYGFWTHDFVRCAPQIERLFENVVRFALSSPSGSGSGSTPAGPPAKPGAQAAGL